MQRELDQRKQLIANGSHTYGGGGASISSTQKTSRCEAAKAERDALYAVMEAQVERGVGAVQGQSVGDARRLVSLLVTHLPSAPPELYLLLAESKVQAG
ncbi:hypothetical protein [Stenotrophomonas sp.]|uniref:hypothetical protein n=1 Tax=Stenotrophomonas sp. TaxID=69392 RepID=UPI00289BB1FB|nr:hypothetical protein [Stenotrophomonas sp.]